MRLPELVFHINFAKFLIRFKFQKQPFAGVLQNSVLKNIAEIIGKPGRTFFLGIAGDLAVKAPKDKIVIFEGLFLVINIYVCHRQGLFTPEKCNYYVFINYIRHCLGGQYIQIALTFFH